MKSKYKTLLVWTLLIVVLVALHQLLEPLPSSPTDFTDFLNHADSGRVASVRIDSNHISYQLADGSRYHTLGVVDDEVTRALSEHGVMVQWGPEKNPLRMLLTVALPLLVLIGALIYFMRKAQGGAANIMQIRRSRARLVPDERKVTFAEVGGCEEAKEELRDVIDFLKSPKRWTDAGVRLPRGVLLEGPPGCGKTLLSRAVAGETDARFYFVSASEFVEMFVGVGAARVRDMFETAAKQAPAVLFIDELDAVGRRRGSGIGAAHDEREQTLNQILVCMDGFDTHDRVVVIAATNRADILDRALLRPGRFDRRIAFPEFDAEQRAEVLRIHTRNKALAEGMDLESLAERTAGLNGADLESLVNEAGLLAVRRAAANGVDPAAIGMADFERALQRGSDSETKFDFLDALLIESTSQLAQPTGRAHVRLTLHDGAVAEGELLWADAAFLKIRQEDGTKAAIPKLQIKTIEPVGATCAGAVDVAPDRWAASAPDLA